MSNILYRLDDIEKLRRGEMVWPSFVDFHTSNVCNMDCLGCAYQSELTNEYMPREKHFETVDMFIDGGTKAFDFAGGGEPTCLPYLASLLRHVADRQAHFALITNGLLLSPELADVLLKHGTYCRVSLEASSRNEFTFYKRVKGWAWDKALDNIQNLVAERNKTKSALEISLKFSVGKSLRGEDHYRKMIELAIGLGVDRVMVKALRHEPEELPWADKLVEEFLLRRIMNANRVNGLFRYWIAPVSEIEIPQCWLNPLHTVVDHRGDIFLCCYYYKRPQSHRIGNIFETPFSDLWFSQEHRQKIREIKRDDCAIYDCKFFAHHKALEDALTRGAIHWL